MANVKYVYKSQFKLIDAIINGSKEAVTSGAVFKALQDVKKDTLFETGYVAEGISGTQSPFQLSLEVDTEGMGGSTLTLAAESMLFIPNGIENDKPQFLAHKTTVDIADDTSGVFPYDTVCMVQLITSGNITSYNFLHKIPRQYKVSATTGIVDTDSEFQTIYVSDNPEGPDDRTERAVWWDTRTNYMKMWENNTWTVKQISVPLALLRSKQTQRNGEYVDYAVEIVELYDRAGYLGNAVWVNPGIHTVFPNGRVNANNMFNVYATVEKVTGLRDNGSLTDEIDMTSDPAAPECQGLNCKFIDLTYLADHKNVLEAVVPVYDTYTNWNIYITQEMEILGPCEELSFNDDIGFFEYVKDGELSPISCCKLITLSTGVLHKEEGEDWNYGHSFELDPALITAFSTRVPLTLADSDDIDYLVRLIGSSNGDTIDSLNVKISKLLERLDALLNDDGDGIIKDIAQEVRNELYTTLGQCLVHKDYPVDYNRTDEASNLVRLGDLSEVVKGNKIFEEPITARKGLNGVASNVELDWYYEGDDVPVEKSPRMMYLTGVPVKYKKDGDDVTDEAVLPNPIEDHEDTNTGYTHDERIDIGVNTNIRIDKDSVYATYFKGIATQSFWGDLAEMYQSDNQYEPGTLLRFGKEGETEVTIADYRGCNAVVSEAPGFLLNAKMKDSLPVALVGRVKVRIMGPIHKGEAVMLHPSIPGVGVVTEDNDNVIARALETNTLTGEKLVLCVVKMDL